MTEKNASLPRACATFGFVIIMGVLDLTGLYLLTPTLPGEQAVQTKIKSRAQFP